MMPRTLMKLSFVALTAAQLLSVAPTSAGAQAAAAPLDLAAMALLPADEVATILDIATPGFGVDFGEAYPSAAAAAAHQGDILGVDPVTLHMAMAVGGYRRGADVAYL